MWMNSVLMDTQQQSEPVAILDIERELMDDAEGVYRDDLLTRLNDAAHQLRSSLQSGLSPEEYPVCSHLLTAVECATGVINRVWLRHHP